MRPVAVVGHICVDLVPSGLRSSVLQPGQLVEAGALRLALGGAVGNTGGVLTALGVPIRVHTLVGDDVLGRFAVECYTTALLVDGAPTVVPGLETSYSIVVSAPGTDRAFWHHVGANAHFDGRQVPVEGVDLLHLGYPSLLPGLIDDGGAGMVDLFARAKGSDVTTSLDLAVIDPGSRAAAVDWREVFKAVLPHVDVLSPSLDDLVSAVLPDAGQSPRRLVEHYSAELVRSGAAVVAISDGARGLHLRTGSVQRLRSAGRALRPLAESWADTVLDVPAATLRAVGTSGAGDASTAGLLAAIRSGLGPEDATLLAVSAAAAVISGAPSVTMAVPERLLRGPSPASAGGAPALVERPVVLAANQPAGRFYAGGGGIGRFRGTQEDEPNTPEDWVASTVCVRGQELAGQSRLPDGRLLRDAVVEDPIGWLGRDHVARFGADPKILVKLLDAGQRLPVHAHPDASFARRAVGAAHGKAEAWYILEPGTIHLGLREEISPDRLRRIVAEQDTDTLLGMLHAVTVGPGDRVYVPPGVLHAIGAGVLLVEVQEPEDLSILLEWRGFELDGERDGHLGLGFEVALTAVETSARSTDDIGRLVVRGGAGEGGLPRGADRFFRLDQVDVADIHRLAPGYCVVVGIAGDLDVVGDRGGRTPVRRGRTLLLPAAAAPLELIGSGTVLLIRPP